MADEPVTEQEPTRELTTEEAFKPVRDIMGEQATGVVDLGQGEFKLNSTRSNKRSCLLHQT